MKKIFWQSEWQNIKFKNIDTPKSVFHPPSSNFYTAFYSELFKKYDGFEDLPIKWKNDKTKISKEIIKLLGSFTNALSIGCGLGFIEKEIVKSLPDLNIDAYDFANTANRWLVDVKRVNSLNSLEGNKKYKFIYCTGLLYALTEREIAKLAEFVKKHLDKDGVFLTVDTSLNINENFSQSIKIDFSSNLNKNSDQQIFQQINFIKFLKDLFRPYYYFFFKRNIYQLWGWKRDNQEIEFIFHKNGFLTNRVFSAGGQSFIMFNLNYNG